MNPMLEQIGLSISSSVEERLFVEYGAIFVTVATPPPGIVFANAEEVTRFQATLEVDRDTFGSHEITLQAQALAALLEASESLRRDGKTLSARSADAGARSYEDTVALWIRNVSRGLAHWTASGEITGDLAESLMALSPIEQVGPILNLEENRNVFFGTFFDRSILYSVAAPGASQHLTLLAFDVAEYEDSGVETELNRRGWHRTVPNDLPHFTYLGYKSDELPELGLKRVTRTVGEQLYGFWVPDTSRLPGTSAR